MPALSPEQRRRQIELQRQREAAAKNANKPKRGQKGATTSGGSKTKAETIGGAKPADKPATKPAAKPAAKPAEKPYVATYTDAQGNVYDGNTGRYLRTMSRGAAKPSPAPSASRPSTPAPTRSSGSTSSTSKPSPKPVPKPAGKVPASSETYRDGGKGLYQGSKEYRDKVGGSGNPLLNRFRNDMGRDANTGGKVEPKMSKPEDKSRYVAPNGQPYKGPAFGNSKSEPAKPASPASPNKSEKGMTLAEKMRRRRMGMG
jgi:hypothetical protein